MRLLPLTLALAAFLPAAAQTAGLGDFRATNGSIVQLYPCATDVCLRVLRLPAEASATTDIYNPDPKLHTRPLCGLTIGTAFHPDTPSDTTHLSGGFLYDPKTGHTWRGSLTLHGDRLTLRGYLGIPLLGRSETWQRVNTPVEPCK